MQTVAPAGPADMMLLLTHPDYSSRSMVAFDSAQSPTPDNTATQRLRQGPRALRFPHQ